MQDDPWPALPFTEWQKTCATLQLWTQIVGKVRAILDFLETSYAAAADRGRRDRASLERRQAATAMRIRS